jgi:pyrroline-5-carboxylate reductase
MRIGFVGTGGITKAVVTGLCASPLEMEGIVLSPRNADVANELARLDARVRIAQSNQHVVDASDVVCIAVLPKIAPEVMRGLTFRNGQPVISFVAGLAMRELEQCIGADATPVRAVPLPTSAQRQGSTVIYPPSDAAKAIFAAIGAAVEVADETQFDAFLAVTATMASFYSVIEKEAQWLTGKGVPYASARTFLAGYHVGLSGLATSDDASFSDLARHCTTEGGINELMQRTLDAQGVFEQFGAGLDAVWKRLETK